MATLSLDEQEQQVFDSAARQYGVVVYGATPAEREAALREAIGSDSTSEFIEIDGREIADNDEVRLELVHQATGWAPHEVKRLWIRTPGLYVAEYQKGVLVFEFDAMDAETQTYVAQTLKGLAERRGYEEPIGYTCEEAGAVALADPDLSARLCTWELQ